MHSPRSRPRPSRLFVLRFAALLFSAGGLLAACDRHSATEVPESYGHGSSHEKSYSDHQIDSRNNSASFSDTHGEDAHEGLALPPTAATPAPTASPTPGSKFF